MHSHSFPDEGAGWVVVKDQLTVCVVKLVSHAQAIQYGRFCNAGSESRPVIPRRDCVTVLSLHNYLCSNGFARQWHTVRNEF